MVSTTRDFVSILPVVLALLLAAGASSSESLDSVCESAWATEMRDDLPPGRHLLFAGGSTFLDGGETYAAGIGLAEGDSATFLVFHVEGPNDAQLVFELRFDFDFLATEETLVPALSGCVLPDLSPYLNLTVLDLDGDGRKELVLESNRAGLCADCLSLVRVFQLRGAEARLVVEEKYRGLTMGEGEGLTVDAWMNGIDGRIIPTQKRFFGRRQPPREP